MKSRTSIIRSGCHCTNLLLSLLAVIVLLIPANAQQGGAAYYRYDANGRLTVVLSPTGEAATYNYDPAGNFTSITRYAANQLSILDFTPGSGGIGTQVTIYGTGFSTTPSANTVKFNNVTASVTAATNIQLTVTVPTGATTGPISITNTNGSFSSSNQFFVSSEALYFSGRINFGETVVLPSSVANKSALLAFSGATGQRVSILVDQVAPVSGGGTLSLISPTGSVVATAPIDAQGFSGFPFGFMEPQTLLQNGDYSIIINPTDTTPVNMNVTLYDVSADISGTIPTTGSPFPVIFSAPGQNAMLSFNGGAGQRVCLLADQSVVTTFLTNVAIQNPNGSNLVSGTLPLGILNPPPTLFFDVVTLPVNGVYKVSVDPQFNKTRTTILNLYDVPPDVADTLSIGAAAKAVTIPSVGQAANLTLSVPGNQQVTIHIRELKIFAGFTNSSTLTLSTQSGTQIFTQTINSNADYDIPRTLSAGTYVLKIDPQQAATGSLNINLTTP
ncbi:MAG: IPT/TIG domain-containing protein [Blastocatellia bacterium]